MAPLHCDVAIIGAGTAGLAAERSARGAGAKTVLIDEHFAGTTCATVGCMPSKLLIAAADSAYRLSQASTFGIHADRVTVDGAAVMHRVQQERDRFAASTRESFAKLPAGVAVRGRARFTGATTLVLQDGRQVEAKAIVIATGARPLVPPSFACVAPRILTNETVFDLSILPESMAVVGSGPLGLELAQSFARLGVAVQLFDEAPRVSGIPDTAIEEQLRASMSDAVGMTLGVTVEAQPAEDGIHLQWTGATQGSRIFERVLLAAGRPPALAELDLARAGLELDAHGVPRYDRTTQQCGTAPIFIAGDADHERPVLHEASAQGTIAGRNAAQYPSVSRSNRFVPLSIMFTDPQLAMVGEVPGPEATHIITGRASFADQGRAKMFARNRGAIHIYADAEHGRLTGATLFGPEVEHLVHLLAWAVQDRMTATQVLEMPFYHPTCEEALKPALRAICDAVHASVNDVATPGE